MNANLPAHPHPRASLRSRALITGLTALFLLACFGTSLGSQPTQTPFVITATVPASSEVVSTLPAIPTGTASPIQPTATTAPSCIVLQNLNLRTGPGTAYNPPIIQLTAGTEFTPTGLTRSGYRVEPGCRVT